MDSSRFPLSIDGLTGHISRETAERVQGEKGMALIESANDEVMSGQEPLTPALSQRERGQSGIGINAVPTTAPEQSPLPPGEG
ncbi:hypothetical protein D3C78_1868590 [compost metagenome]